MQHAEFRRLFGADPKRTEPAVLEHRATCAECARYAADLEKVDALVAGAFDAPAPNYRKPWEIEAGTVGAAADDEAPAARARHPMRWFALAAGIVLLSAIGVGSWLQVKRDALFAEVIKHADKERDVMVVSDKRVSLEKLHKTLAKAGARLHGELPVSVARTCKIRGAVAPHLIMQTPDGVVAVLLLTNEKLYLPHSSEKQGYLAELVPVGDHSIAVVGTSEAAVEQGAKMASSAIDWAPFAPDPRKPVQ
ncbi:MAG TPA: DUF3379 family protein [Steroidobacteraceae bacterium]|nr:DUF3379 family protein [Steroidobacteraceae bacterium]